MFDVVISTDLPAKLAKNPDTTKINFKPKT